jgi:Signal transduction histidine kinase
MRTIIRVFVSVIVITAILSGCTTSNQRPTTEAFTPLDYKNIPGVTSEEIDAIEKIKSERDSLSYGMTISTEAFQMAGTGEHSGFSSIFADELSTIFGIDFEVSILDWDDLMDRFNSGKIDFTSELTETPERLEIYEMSMPVADRTMGIFTTVDGESLEKISEVRKPKYAFLEGTAMYDWVKNAEGDRFEAVFAQNDTELINMLESGEIDAFFQEIIAAPFFDSVDTITHEYYFPMYFAPVSLATAQDELAPFITVINKYIVAGYDEQLARMYDKGDQLYQKSVFLNLLNDEEKEYIMQHVANGEAIPIILEADNYPNSFWNNYDNEYQGVAVDIVNQITEITGLTFNNLNTPDTPWSKNLSDLEAGTVVMVTDLWRIDTREGKFLWADTPYLIDRYAMVSLAETPDATLAHILASNVGAKDETAIVDLYPEWFPNSNDLFLFPTNTEALEALDKGKVDFVMMSRSTLLFWTNFLEKPGYKANIVFDTQLNSQFGFNIKEETLRSVVSKAQSHIDTNKIADNWNRKTFAYSRTQMQFVTYFFVLLSAVFVLLLILFIFKQRMNKKLEQTVEMRTKELALQTDLANVASQSKSDFLSRMSHEIRTPLNAIMGMTEITRRAAGDKEKVIYGTTEISSASKHLMAIINDILDMSKIEAGKFHLNEESFYLVSALDEIYSIMYQRFHDKKIDFLTDFGDFDNVCVYGDRLRLKQVLINLIGNAVKFTPAGGQVTFAAHPDVRTEDTFSVEFKIIDTGIGMSEEQRERLFTAFEQADKSISVKYGGTGLGLAISQSLVSLMDSEIKVDSIEGEGTTFSFKIVFPFGESAVSFDAGETAIPDLGNNRILVAEDVEINRIILKELLADTKLKIDEAEDGQIAIDMFKNSEEYYYDLIFMDVQMPNVSGYQATEAIRAMDRSDAVRIPIIAMTANAYREDIECALESGMNGHIAKPIDIKVVIRTLVELIKS